LYNELLHLHTIHDQMLRKISIVRQQTVKWINRFLNARLFSFYFFSTCTYGYLRCCLWRFDYSCSSRM